MPRGTVGRSSATTFALPEASPATCVEGAGWLLPAVRSSTGQARSEPDNGSERALVGSEAAALGEVRLRPLPLLGAVSWLGAGEVVMVERP